MKLSWLKLIPLVGLLLWSNWTLMGVPSRDNSFEILLPYMLMVAGWLYALSTSWTKRDIAVLLFSAILLRGLWLIAPAPTLSDDYIRFVWDGILTSSGENPYLSLPSEYSQLAPELYEKLNSKEYYSVYPPFLQILFQTAYKLGGDIEGSIFFLRLLILMVEFGSIYLLSRILGEKKRALTLVYALCPLAIVEMTGSIHFEAFMTFGVLLAVRSWEKRNLMLGVLGLSIAISSKLIPVLLLPLLVYRLKLRQAIFSAVASLLLSASLFFIWWHPIALPNMLESIRLYYEYFEFNASIYYVVRFFGQSFLGYNPIAQTGPALAIISGLVILMIAYFRRPRDSWEFMLAVGLVFASYQLFATTVHPWYIAPICAFMAVPGRPGAFKRSFRFAWIWAALIPLTYVAYRNAGFRESYLILYVEYGLVLTVLLIEALRGSAMWFHWQKKNILERAAIKVNRIKPYLEKDFRYLDLGTGNGGVAELLRRESYQIQGMDVQDRDFFKSKILLYNGRKIPLEDKTYDAGFLLTVLHHCEDPDKVLAELGRVCDKQLFVMEDVSSNAIMAFLTKSMDSLVNDEWMNHPHQNRTIAEWEASFKKQGLFIKKRIDHRILLIFKQVTWILEIPNENEN
jgi:SAM-dependent methyltransferase